MLLHTDYARHIVRCAYDFEVSAIEACDSKRNPYVDEILSWENGSEIWEAINVALELKYGR